MKVYVCDSGSHHKNRESIRKMMMHNNIECFYSDDLSHIDDTYNIAICVSKFFPPDRFPKQCKVIYGPQFFVFPYSSHDIHKYVYDPSRFFYNTLSNWNQQIHTRCAPTLSLTFAPIPYGIDIDHIQEVQQISQRNKIMIYFKHRHPSELNIVQEFLDAKKHEYNLISYGSYNDADFKHKLQETRFVIWIGSHESQGFGFQETQASNVPILLWDVTSMRDEYVGGRPYGLPSGNPDDLAATTANCWSDKCGIKFFRKEELADAYDRMNEQVGTFTPRKYIADRLSLKAAFENLLAIIGL